MTARIGLVALTPAERQRRHLARHGERIRARRRKVYSANLDASRASGREKTNLRYANIPAHREKVKLNARARHLWICFRLTPEEYATISAFQGGVCAGCGDAPRGVRLAVDHCHKTGRIRGLLCWLCNRAAGLLKDRAHAAAGLSIYLTSPTAPQALGKETFGLIGRAKANKKVKIYGDPMMYAAFIKAVE